MSRTRFRYAIRSLLVGAVLLGVAAAGIAAGTAGADVPAPQAPTKTIKLGDNFFSPSNVTVTAGTVVTFKWTGSNTHNVTVVKGPQKFTGPSQSDGSYVRRLTKTGTYKVVCTFHPGMTLTLKVKKAPKTTTSSSTPPSS